MVYTVFKVAPKLPRLSKVTPFDGTKPSFLTVNMCLCRTVWTRLVRSDLWVSRTSSLLSLATCWTTTWLLSWPRELTSCWLNLFLRALWTPCLCTLGHTDSEVCLLGSSAWLMTTLSHIRIEGYHLVFVCRFEFKYKEMGVSSWSL